MAKIIIGIHGLRNKPPQKLLKKWWKRSIRDGLAYYYRFPIWLFRFDLAYWADVLHSHPLNPNEKNPKDLFYITGPYNPPQIKRINKKRKIRKKVLDVLEKQMDKIFLNDDKSLNFEAITDIIIRHYFEDLNDYYTAYTIDRDGKRKSVKEIIRSRLSFLLEKHHKKKICLIAHSMGSIIAYDVLTHCDPNIGIDTLITMGSPLGISVIMKKIIEEQKLTLKIPPLQTPENIHNHWYNFSDLEDKVALNYNLSDDYAPNSKGVRVIDMQVYNNYHIHDKRNPHKSYGYLRTKEIAAVLKNFLKIDFLKK